jgi:hypothetical protein
MKLGNLPQGLEGLMKLLPPGLGPKVTPQDMDVKKQLEGLGAGPELFKEAGKKHIPPGAITKTFIEAGGGQKGLEAVTKFIQEAKAPPEMKLPKDIAGLLDIR